MQNKESSTLIASKKPPKHNKFLVFISILLILLICSGWIFWQLKGKTIQAFFATNRQPQITKQIATLLPTLPNKESTIQETPKPVLSQPALQPAPIAEKNLDTELTEITLLVKMANITLTTSGDVATTLEFLQAAKKQISSAKYLAISYAISKDIATLQATPTVDVVNVIARLDAINQQILNLPIIPQMQPVTTILSNPPQTISAPIWQRFSTAVLNTLKELVIIRHNTVQPLPLPEQMLTVRLNIQAKILQAEWAALHKNKQMYQACLAQASDWIQHYFALDVQLTKTVINTINDLQKVEVQPQLPTLNASMQAIQDANYEVKVTFERPKPQAEPLEKARLL